MSEVSKDPRRFRFWFKILWVFASAVTIYTAIAAITHDFQPLLVLASIDFWLFAGIMLSTLHKRQPHRRDLIFWGLAFCPGIPLLIAWMAFPDLDGWIKTCLKWLFVGGPIVAVLVAMIFFRRPDEDSISR